MMRQLSYLAIALAAISVVNIAASLVFPEYAAIIRTAREQLLGKEWAATEPFETGRESTSGKTGTVLGADVVTGIETIRVSHSSWALSDRGGSDTQESRVEMPEALLLRLIPKIVLEKTDKSRIFGREFPELAYATYADTRYEMGTHVINTDIDSFVSLWGSESDRFRETDAFFGRTVFYNGMDDGRVRFLFSFADKTIAIDLPSQHYYDPLKPLLLP